MLDSRFRAPVWGREGVGRGEAKGMRRRRSRGGQGSPLPPAHSQPCPLPPPGLPLSSPAQSPAGLTPGTASTILLGELLLCKLSASLPASHHSHLRLSTGPSPVPPLKVPRLCPGPRGTGIIQPGGHPPESSTSQFPLASLGTLCALIF